MSACYPFDNETVEKASASVTSRNPLAKSAPDTNENASALSWMGRYIRSALQRYAVKRQQKIDRDAFSMMLSLDDSLLDDIGVTRGDVTWAANLPLSEDAATRLRACAKGSS